MWYRYSFYCFTEGERLNWSRHCSNGLRPGQSYSDKYYWSLCNLILKPTTQHTDTYVTIRLLPRSVTCPNSKVAYLHEQQHLNYDSNTLMHLSTVPLFAVVRCVDKRTKVAVENCIRKSTVEMKHSQQRRQNWRH